MKNIVEIASMFFNIKEKIYGKSINGDEEIKKKTKRKEIREIKKNMCIRPVLMQITGLNK
jgi:hypothetical protein